VIRDAIEITLLITDSDVMTALLEKIRVAKGATVNIALYKSDDPGVVHLSVRISHKMNDVFHHYHSLCGLAPSAKPKTWLFLFRFGQSR
jgi:hypothetical protein